MLNLNLNSLNEEEKDELKIYNPIYYYNKNLKHIIYRFEILKQIGQGSFSKVYKVYDHKNKCNYAIKKISSSNFSKLNNIYNEIEILQSLKKKEENNITKIFEYFFFRNNLYIVLKLYYSTLHEYIYNSTNYIDNKSKHLNYIKQLTKAIDFLNKNNIIHSDIKPNNIVFKDSTLENIILIDFGNSCFSNNINYRTNLKIQTIYYRAPEIIITNLCNTKIEYNYKIDIWSLGCIIYELFYKKRLFDSSNNLELFVNYNIIFDHPKISLLKKLKELHKYYDDIDYPSYIKLNNVIYGFKKKNFIKKHQDKQDIIELVVRCCEWDMEDRINCDQILKYCTDMI